MTTANYLYKLATNPSNALIEDILKQCKDQAKSGYFYFDTWVDKSVYKQVSESLTSDEHGFAVQVLREDGPRVLVNIRWW